VVSSKFFLPAVVLSVVVTFGVAAAYILTSTSTEKKEAQTEAPVAARTTTKPSEGGVTPAPVVSLSITSPRDGAIVTSPNLAITGKTEPLSDITVNDKDLKADNKGNFSTTIILEDGKNYLLVTVVNQEGNYTEQELTITYSNPANQ
jgi:hypothetical protein